jgi:hypothetical protein
VGEHEKGAPVAKAIDKNSAFAAAAKAGRLLFGVDPARAGDKHDEVDDGPKKTHDGYHVPSSAAVSVTHPFFGRSPRTLTSP